MNDPRGPLTVLADVRERIPHDVALARPGIQEATGGLRIRDDGGQRLADLVGETGRELTERGDPLDMGNLLAVAPDLFQRLLRTVSRQRAREDLGEQCEARGQLTAPLAFLAGDREREEPGNR